MALSSYKVDQPHIVVVHILEDWTQDIDIGIREIHSVHPLSSSRNSRVEGPGCMVTQIQEVAGIPEDLDSRLHDLAALRLVRIRARDRLQDRIACFLRSHRRHIVRPQMSPPARVEERASDDQSFPLVCLIGNGRGHRCAGVFALFDSNILYCDLVDERCIKRCARVLGHRVLWSRKYDFPEEF